MADEAKGIERDTVIEAKLQNRAFDRRVLSSDTAPLTIGLYLIDKTILEYISQVMRPTVKVNNEGRVVPVVFANQERWKSIRKDGLIRDNDDKIQTPLIVLGRSSFARSSKMSNPINKYHSHLYEKRWNTKTPYDKFAALNNMVPSKEYVAITIPEYVDITYEVMIWTDFLEQMNPLVEMFNFESYEFWGQKGGFKFKAVIEDFQQDNDIPADADRIIRSSFQMKVEAYLLPEEMIDRNKRYISTSIKLNSAKKSVIFTETESE